MMIEKRSPVKTVLLYIVLILLTFITLLPLLWMVSSSFKLSSEVFSFPIKWIPETWHWENFVTIWQKINLATYTMNSFKLSILITLIQLLTSSFAAYGFSKCRFPGRNVLFLAYIATIDEKSLIIFVSTARQALYNNEAYATIAARTRVRYVSIGESDEERAHTLFLQCLEEGGFSLAPEADATLRSVISFVLSVGDNRGYRAIRELASEMIYDQLSSCSPHDVLLKEDVEKYLAESDWGKRYGRLRAGAKMGLVG